MAMTIVAYIPAFKAGFIWDDDDYVTNNKLVQKPSGLAEIWIPRRTPQYYPLVFGTFWIEHQLWGLEPAGYHVVNVVLHALGAVLLWRILRMLDVPAAWLAGAIFALHPVHVESVAWITERKNVLSGVFYLSAVMAYLRFAGLGDSAAIAKKRRLAYALSLVFFIMALLSKTVTSTLPAALLLILWWKKPRIGKSDVLQLLPMFVIGVGMGLLTVWLERAHVGAKGEHWNFTLLQRAMLAGRICWFYAGKLIWPSRLTFVYPRWKIDQAVVWQYLFSISALVVIAALWALRRRIGKGPLAAVGFFAGSLFPALGFFDVYPMRFSFVADHFQYLASIGIICLVCSAVWRISILALKAKTLRIAAAMILLLALGALTWRQCYVYQDLETLWTDTLAKNPSAYIAHNNLGTIYAQLGEIEKAGEHFRIALEQMPDFTSLGNMALYYSKKGQTELAIEHYQKALELEPRSPHLHNGLASLLINMGQLEQASVHCEKALELADNFAEAHNNMGVLLMRQKHLDQALECFDRALKINNKFTIAQINRGEVLMALGRFEEAARCFQIAIRQDSRSVNAHIQLGNAYLRMGKTDQAVSMFKTAIEIEPSNGLAHARLGDSMATRGLFAQAMPYYLRAMELGFSSPELYSNMGVALEANGRLLDAREAYQQAISMAPDWAQAHYCMGLLLEKLDMPDEAISHLRTALQLEPQHKQAQENLHRMEQGIAPPDWSQ